MTKSRRSQSKITPTVSSLATDGNPPTGGGSPVGISLSHETRKSATKNSTSGASSADYEYALYCDQYENFRIKPEWVRENLPCISEDKVEDFASRLDAFLGTGLLRRAEQRSQERQAKIFARIEELRSTGMSAAEGRKILLAEGYNC